jgi:tetratricopeptide (TPR) repeat protein
MALLSLLLLGCQTEAEKSYKLASAKEEAEGLAAAFRDYEEVVELYPETESAARARIKVLDYQRARDQAALRLFNEAEGKPDEEALAAYHRIVEVYGDTQIASTASTRVKRIEAQRQATTFSSDEYAQLVLSFRGARERAGEALLSRTHPTGTYGYTEDPSIVLSSDRRALTTRFSVRWRGGIAETPYLTVYSLVFHKANKALELDSLEVMHDDAIFKIDPGMLRSAEADLRRVFEQNAVFK